MPDIVYGLAWVSAIGWPALAVAGLVFWRGLGWAGAFAAALISVVWAVGVWAILIEPKMLVVRRVDVISETWPGEPLRIGVLSDVHIGGPHAPVSRVKAVVERLNAERPDVIVLVGDYVGGHVPLQARSPARNAVIADGLAALGELSAPLGVYAVLGNHDWWYDGREVEARITGAGIPVLENGAVAVDRPEGRFWIAGLADFESLREEPSYVSALRDVPEADPAIVLSHWPDAFASAPDSVALTIAAHSHCGQVNLPLLGRIVHASTGSKIWPCGLYDVRKRKLYVTGGVGVSVLPARFRQPPEIGIITLRAAGIAPPLQRR
jgi:predicted MPP superfamily phosphohydrolase